MIQPVNALTPKVLFRGSVDGYKNPVNLRTERRLALLNAAGISTVLGAVTTAITRGVTSCWRNASFLGIGAGAVTMMFLAPKFIYKSRINSYAKQQEMDVFTKEKEVQKKLLNDANKAIDNHSDDYHTTLDSYSKTLVKKSA